MQKCWHRVRMLNTSTVRFDMPPRSSWESKDKAPYKPLSYTQCKGNYEKPRILQPLSEKDAAFETATGRTEMI